MVAKIYTAAAAADTNSVATQPLAFAKKIADRIQEDAHIYGAQQTLSDLSANLNRAWAIYFS